MSKATVTVYSNTHPAGKLELTKRQANILSMVQDQLPELGFTQAQEFSMKADFQQVLSTTKPALPTDMLDHKWLN